MKIRHIDTMLRLIAIVLPLFFAWEMLQAPAFAGMPHDWWGSAVICGKATLGDVVIVLALFGIGMLVGRDFRWFARPKLGPYLAIVVVGIGVQVAVEWAALRTGRWSYTAWHPTLPPLGTGLFPVLQAVLFPLTFRLLALWEHRRPSPTGT